MPDTLTFPPYRAHRIVMTALYQVDNNYRVMHSAGAYSTYPCREVDDRLLAYGRLESVGDNLNLVNYTFRSLVCLYSKLYRSDCAKVDRCSAKSMFGCQTLLKASRLFIGYFRNTTKWYRTREAI